MSHLFHYRISRSTVATMFCRALIAAFISTVTAFECSAQPDCSAPRDFERQDRDKVVGGRVATISNWPGQVALRLRLLSGPFYFCGGTLISKDWVLTAAHCIKDKGIVKADDGWYSGHDLVEIELGQDNLQHVSSADVRGISDIIMHEDYVEAGRGDDVALIQLDKPWDGAVAKLSLDSAADPSLAWVTPLMVAGFGVEEQSSQARQFAASDGTKFQAGSATLLETIVPLADEASCHAAYPAAVVGAGQICAGFVQGLKDACYGDSGGPLVAFDRRGCPYQVGVVSWGAGCARENAYSVYTRVSTYASWIRNHITEVKSIQPDDINKVTGDTNPVVEAAFAQLSAVLHQAGGNMQIILEAGPKVQVGGTTKFTVRIQIRGRPIVIDINSRGEVSQLFPNSFETSAVLPADTSITIPKDNSYVFRVVEPFGRSKVVALVVPDNFNMEALNVAKATKGIEVQSSLPYLQNLINLIQIGSGAKGLEIQPVTTGSGFGLASLDYEVVK